MQILRGNNSRILKTKIAKLLVYYFNMSTNKKGGCNTGNTYIYHVSKFHVWYAKYQRNL